MGAITRSLRMLRGDLIEAWEVWRRRPWLPVASTVLILLLGLPAVLFQMSGTGADAPGAVFVFVGLPTLLIGAFVAGWMGTERLVYLAEWTDQDLSVGDLWTASWGYAGRFITLGLIVLVVPAAILVAVVTLAGGPGSTPAAGAVATTIVVLSLLTDLALTFVTPALAFSTRSSWAAIAVGMRTLRTSWPLDVSYVLIPPLVLAVLSQTTSDIVTSLALSVLWALAGLLAKGAIARFYLRRHSPDSAAIPITTITTNLDLTDLEATPTRDVN